MTNKNINHCINKSNIKVFETNYGAGWLNLKIINDWLVELEKFQVCEKYRRKGIGSALLAEAIRIAKDKNYGKISMLCRADNIFALSLYEKFGFKREAELKNHFKKNESMYVMSKEICAE